LRHRYAAGWRRSRRAQFRLEGRLQKSWREHDRIVQSILARDIAAAGSASRDHLTVVGAASVIFVNDDAIAT
jgi:DNA-binding FadR family transcriptional regulator